MTKYNNISRETRDLLIEQARHMRQNPTQAESLLWHHLRKKRLGGHKFRRQHIIQTFIVDFCCPTAKLIIEVDGGVHQGQVEYDRVREDHLRAAGYRVLRFKNEEIFNDLQHVLNIILDNLDPDME